MTSEQFDQILKIIMAIGIPSIIGSCIYIGRKLQILDDLQKSINNLRKDISEIRNEIRKVWEKISDHGEDIQGLKTHTNYGYSNSPTVPNEKGKKLLEKTGFYKIYPELKDEIFGLMDSQNLRTLYDYEKGSEKVLQQLRNNPAIDPLKNYAVNHPDESLELIFKVASWVVRDDYEKYKSSKMK